MISPTCYQYVVKIKKKEEQKGYIPFLKMDELSIKVIPYHIAKDFILQYEWIGNMGTSKYCFGLYFGDLLTSVVCYGPLVAPKKYTKLFGIASSRKIIQLCRGATSYWAPVWAASKLVSKSLKILYSEFGIEIVVAYADPEAGEVGIIYQSCNAYFLGRTVKGGGKKYTINGHTYDPRKAFKKFGSVSRENLLKIDPNYLAIPINPKLRYMFLLGTKKQKSENYKKIHHLISPHPKRLITENEVVN